MKIAVHDNNFLNGKLSIVSEDETIFGRLVVYDSFIDTYVDFTCSANCADGDNFNAADGIKLVKLKLAKKYHTYVKQRQMLFIKEYEKLLKAARRKAIAANNKINHIDYELSKF